MVEFDLDEWGRRPFALEMGRTRLALYRVMAGFFASERFNYELVSLAQDFELPEIEHGLISVAIGTRMLLDQRGRNHEGAECGMLIPDVQNGQAMERLSLREACNKIIHADTRAFDVDNPSTPSRLEPTLHLRGSLRGKRWRVQLDLVRFAEQVEALVDQDTAPSTDRPDGGT